jgi:glyoxylase-like metal-dependent hydrolase (beta-lactamase superfamily II)/rhodanese-related sulfurtransferase
VEDYLRDLAARGLRLRLVIDTHTHADHLSGAAELRARTGADVLLSAAARSDVATTRLHDGDRLALGCQELKVLASPGHTDDSISLLVDGALLTGDALLIGGAGRTDFQNGSPEALYDTLHRSLAALPDELTVYPGHDYTGHTHSTLAQERQTNPLLRLTDRERFVATLRAGRQATPANMEAIVAANIRGVAASPSVTAAELAAALASPAPPIVVDVRLPAEYQAQHLEPSRLLPLDEISRRRDELPRDRDIVLVCRTGARARLAAAELGGFRARVLDGGLVAWHGSVWSRRSSGPASYTRASRTDVAWRCCSASFRTIGGARTAPERAQWSPVGRVPRRYRKAAGGPARRRSNRPPADARPRELQVRLEAISSTLRADHDEDHLEPERPPGRSEADLPGVVGGLRRSRDATCPAIEMSSSALLPARLRRAPRGARRLRCLAEHRVFPHGDLG